MILAETVCFGQTKQLPKNLNEAISILDSDCTDSLKIKIKGTPDNDLQNLSYPYGGPLSYKTIYEWTKKGNDTKLSKYLSDKGVASHQETVILIAFKNHLNGKQFNEKYIFIPYQEIEKKWNAEDKARFTTDTLRGNYIPKDLDDCFNQINSFWDDSTKLKVKQLNEDEFSAQAHFGLGLWKRNNWQLWGGSRLSKYFNDMGIHHPDDMSGIIIDSYYRYLNDKEIRLKEQIQYYKDYWEKSEREEFERKQKEFADYKIGDTILYKYNLGFATPLQQGKYDKDICLAIGKILERDEAKLVLKVRLIESCDSKGIIWYDNENTKILNDKTKKWEKPKKRVVKHMKVGQVNTFNYDDWDTK